MQSVIYFLYLANWGIPKKAPEHLGRCDTSKSEGAAELSPGGIPGPAGFTCISGIHAGTVYHIALILSCNRAGISGMFEKMSLGLLQVYVI